MDALIRAAEAVLQRHAAPALRLNELLALVRAETGSPALPTARLRTALESTPDRFRLLDPWRGPWRFVRRGQTGDNDGEPWVVLVGDPGDHGAWEGSGHRSTRARLRASVRWLGATMDADSSRSLTRWHAIVTAERRARAQLSSEGDRPEVAVSCA